MYNCIINFFIKETIEGTSNYYVTGESYASNIQLAGYNFRDKNFYTKLILNHKYYQKNPTFSYI